MLSALRARRPRLLAVGLGAALLVPLSVVPAVAQTPAAPQGAVLPAAGGTVVGQLVRAYADPRKDGKREDAQHAKPLTWIEPAHGAAVRVPTDQATQLPLGATVKVSVGAAVNDSAATPAGVEKARQVLAASVVSPAAAVPAPSSAAASFQPYTNEVTVVKVHPSGDATADPMTIATLLNAVNNPVADFWEGQSRSAIRIHASDSSEGDAWYTATAGCASPTTLWDEVAAHIGFTAGPGKHLLLYLPNDPSVLPDCAYGLGEVGTGILDGGRMYVRDSITSVIAHELGHNFGLGHSSELQCNRSLVNGTCAVAPYADLYDVMGFSWDQLGSLSAPQEARLGLLRADDVADLGNTRGNADVRLRPMGSHVDDGRRAIRIAAADGLTYWIEFRSPVGQDAWLGDPSLNYPHLDGSGVFIRVEDEGDSTSLLLDATPSAQAGWNTDLQTAMTARAVWLSGLDYYLTVYRDGDRGAWVHVAAGDAALPRDLDRNYRPDLLTADPGGVLYRYDSNGSGGFAGRVIMGRGWQHLDLITMVGDWTGGGLAQDVVARDGLGQLWLYPGPGRNAGFATPHVIGRGWQGMSALFSPGDWNGDGNVDLIARRRSDGALLLYPGMPSDTGLGSFLPPVRIGNGWQIMSSFIPTGDFDGNGTVDFAARRTDGTLYLYEGDGHGGFAGTRVIGRGWQGFSSITGVGDWDGDGAPDLLARRTDGTLWLYPGTGDGGFRASRRIGTGWGSFRMAV